LKYFPWYFLQISSFLSTETGHDGSFCFDHEAQELSKADDVYMAAKDGHRGHVGLEEKG